MSFVVFNPERRGMQTQAKPKPFRELTGLAFVSGLIVLSPLFPGAFRILFLCINVVAFVMFVEDKRRAVEREKRIKETWLHLITLGGGFVGAQLGRATARHKTLKPAFDGVFCVAWLLWLVACVLYWLYVRR
ncbi:hypothetical protein BLA13014_08388 [Burkholderia aenigmatica]|jgi:uncharacterized membrane protein YsdA (DUF1294 family)|uniref:DUF1294 domain-containing protein n=1 Tax=Burkholderia aenigmatica TaxID=2015348 RepID=A0A6P2T066_9BURK|nr:MULTISPECIES: DUF1294 domain-containing protein [Burkholderia]VWC54915.1 hypothetical protein BLA13014_08388 [Burkholderia aenigmatica]